MANIPVSSREKFKPMFAEGETSEQLLLMYLTMGVLSLHQEECRYEE